MEHECKQEDKIDKLLISNSNIEQAICGGNGQIGLNQRIENIEKILQPLAYVCIVIGASFVFLKDFFITHGNK